MASTAPSERTVQMALDYAERAFLLVLAVPFFIAFSRRLHDDPWTLGLMFTEGMVLMLALFRRRGWMNPAPYPAFLAVAATGLPLLFRPGSAALLWIGGPMIGGAAVWCLAAKAMMNRRWGVIPANRGIQTKGPYAIMRHPVYAGYLVSHLGLLLSWPTLANIVIFAVAWTAQIARIFEEEKLLSLDPAYRAYQEKVRYRLVPGVF